MKTTLRALALALLSFAALARLAGAQDVSLSCLGGERLSDGDLARGTTIVVVWASWSPRSRDIVQRVNPLASRWKGGARVITVNFQEERQTIDGFLAGKGLGAPVCLDPDGLFSRKYNVATLPGLLVVKNGQVAYHGKLPDDPERFIADLLH
ncbi:MAG: TlpA family protein disulfide reductase [Acidobacteria bacterium]|nr:TlpA family protein disulfide reductase [Acidobacteriota bacterium]